MSDGHVPELMRPLRAAVVAAVLALPSLAAGQSARSPWGAQEAVRGALDYTTPGAGRVRLSLVSLGAPQRVVVEQRGATPRGVRVLGAGTCETPCALYVTPGPLTLRAEAWRLRDTDITFDAPPRPSLLHLRAASRTQWNVGVGLTGAGATVFLALVGFALVTQASSTGASLPTEAAIGGGIVSGVLLAVGVPLLVLNRTGVASLVDE